MASGRYELGLQLPACFKLAAHRVDGRVMAGPQSASRLGEATPPPGWWLASDGRWYPPELHPAPAQPVPSSPSPSGLPLLSPEMPPPLSEPGSQTNSARWDRKWIVAAGAVVVVLLLVGGILLSHGSSPKTPTALAPASPTVNPIQVAADQFKQDQAGYAVGVQSPVAAITADNADLAKQADRISTDDTTYQNNAFGTGCNIGDYTTYSSCVSQEQQVAASAQADETAALAAAKSDHSQAETSDQQMETVISTYVQQLDSIAWPASIRQDAQQLAQSLTDLRGAFGQEATDILNGLSITQDNQAMSTDGSDIQTETINLATALGIPPPAAGAAT